MSSKYENDKKKKKKRHNDHSIVKEHQKKEKMKKNFLEKDSIEKTLIHWRFICVHRSKNHHTVETFKKQNISEYFSSFSSSFLSYSICYSISYSTYPSLSFIYYRLFSWILTLKTMKRICLWSDTTFNCFENYGSICRVYIIPNLPDDEWIKPHSKRSS